MDHEVTRVHPHPQSPQVINRLRRLEGHIRALRQMAEEGRPCADLLHQLGAIEAALRRCGRVILEEHLDHCIAGAVSGPEGHALIDDLKRAMSSYLR